MSANTDKGTAVPNLGYSRPFDVWNVSNDKTVKEVVDMILARTGNQRCKKKTKGHYRRTVKAIVIDCYKASEENKEKWIGIPCNAEAYAKNKRLRKLNFRHKVVLRALNDLEDLGLIQRYPGYYDPVKGEGKLTRIKGTDELLARLNDTEYLPITIGHSKQKPVILLKDENKKEIEYRSNATIRGMECNIRRINEAMKSNIINLYLSDAGRVRLNERMCEEDDCHQVLDEKQTSLHRVFNNGSFEQGGRFYGAWWQSVPSEYRSLIRINEQETVELDYSALHPTMLYCIEGITDIPEPYMLPGLDDCHRNTVKPILNIMFNAKSMSSAVKAVRQEVELGSLPKPFCDAKYLVEQYLEKHKAINKYMNSSWGVKLQYQDSEMAETIMLSLLEDGIVALPVHDSFIVTADNEDRLKQEMLKVFQNKYRHDIAINKSNKVPIDGEPTMFDCDEYRAYCYRILDRYALYPEREE